MSVADPYGGPMSHLMPEPLSTWMWRLERVRNGRTMLTRSQAAAARTDLMNDRAAHPESYTGMRRSWRRRSTSSLCSPGRPTATTTSCPSWRRSGVGLSARRRRTAPQPDPRSTARTRSSLAADHDRVPAGLPEPLDQWVHRLIRYRAGVKIITPIEAARAEIRLRNEADLQPAAYRSGVAAGYYHRTIRELGEIGTAERPGSRDGSGLVRGLSGSSPDRTPPSAQRPTTIKPYA